MKAPTLLKPQLGVCTRIPEFGNASGMCTTTRELTDEEIRAYQEASREIAKFRQNRQLRLLVEINYKAYIEVKNEILGQFKKSPACSYERLNEMIVEINCVILNYLSGVRSYTDQGEASLKHEFGKQSTQAAEFKAAASKEFDGDFSYRFLCQLRNFTQHVGLPLGRLNLNASSTPPNTQVEDAKIEILFDRDYLLSSFDGWKLNINEELKGMPEHFDVQPHLEKVVASIGRLDKVLIKYQSTNLNSHLTVLETLANEVKDLDGYPCIYTSITPNQKGDGLNTELQRLPVEAMVAYRRLIAESATS